jgi:zinc/manganese transport system permease protein
MAAISPAISPNPFTVLRELTTYPFMVHALLAGTIVAVMAGVAGWFMVLRRESFAAHTLSLMAFPGATGALLVGLPAAAGYFGFCGASALVLGSSAGAGARRNHSQESALTGTVQAVGLGCGFVFLSLYHGVIGDYESLLFGDFLGITAGQVAVLAAVAAAALAFFALAGRPLLFASLDPGVARARGVPVRGLSLAFLLVLGLAVAATAQITGVLLVFALLVAPAATAQLITPRIGASLALTVALGIAVTWVGLGLAYFYGEPVGFEITTVAFVAYALARLAHAMIERAGTR